MLSSISPLGERARRQRWTTTVTAYVIASTLAGAAVGGALGLVGAGFGRDAGAAGVAAIALIAAAGLVLDLGFAGLRVPGPRRQVDERWLTTYRGWVYGAGFGAQLGAGFVTVVATSATWVAFAAALVAGSPLAGLAIGAVFGAVRALPVLTTARMRSPADLNRRFARLERGAGRVRRIGLASQAGVAIALLAVLASGGAS